MDQRPHLRTMIAEGKDRLEWYRQVRQLNITGLFLSMLKTLWKKHQSTRCKSIMPEVRSHDTMSDDISPGDFAHVQLRILISYE